MLYRAFDPFSGWLLSGKPTPCLATKPWNSNYWGGYTRHFPLHLDVPMTRKTRVLLSNLLLLQKRSSAQLTRFFECVGRSRLVFLERLKKPSQLSFLMGGSVFHFFVCVCFLNPCTFSIIIFLGGWTPSPRRPALGQLGPRPEPGGPTGSITCWTRAGLCTWEDESGLIRPFVESTEVEKQGGPVTFIWNELSCLFCGVQGNLSLLAPQQLLFGPSGRQVDSGRTWAGCCWALVRVVGSFRKHELHIMVALVAQSVFRAGTPSPKPTSGRLVRCAAEGQGQCLLPVRLGASDTKHPSSVARHNLLLIRSPNVFFCDQQTAPQLYLEIWPAFVLIRGSILLPDPSSEGFDSKGACTSGTILLLTGTQEAQELSRSPS